MWLSGTGYLNEPSDGSARSVANHWGLVLSGSSAGSCHVEGGCFPTRVEGALDERYKDLPQGRFGHAEASVLDRAGVGEPCSTEPEPFFCPNCPMDRATLVGWLAQVDDWDLSDPPQTPSFRDVDLDHVHYAAVEEALRRGLTHGCGDDRFCPDETLEREHAAAFIARTHGWEPEGPASFADVSEDHVFYEEIQALEERCVVEACETGGFCPDEDFTRAMAAVWLTMAWDLEDRNECLGSSFPWDTGPDSAPPSWWNESGEPGLGPGPRARLAGDCGCSSAPGGGWAALAMVLYALRKRTS